MIHTHREIVNLHTEKSHHIIANQISKGKLKKISKKKLINIQKLKSF